jgi:hypothetical protein
VRSTAKIIVGILGIVITILGHLLDKSEKYPFVVDFVAPSYIQALTAYEEMLNSSDFLGKGSPKIMKPGDSGFVEIAKVLAQDFPEIRSNVNIVEQIRIKDLGSVAGGYLRDKGINYSGIQPHFELSLAGGRVLSKYVIDLRSAIRKMFLEDSLFYWGSVVFWVGVLITISSLFI